MLQVLGEERKVSEQEKINVYLREVGRGGVRSEVRTNYPGPNKIELGILGKTLFFQSKREVYYKKKR